MALDKRGNFEVCMIYQSVGSPVIQKNMIHLNRYQMKQIEKHIQRTFSESSNFPREWMIPPFEWTIYGQIGTTVREVIWFQNSPPPSITGYEQLVRTLMKYSPTLVNFHSPEMKDYRTEIFKVFYNFTNKLRKIPA